MSDERQPEVVFFSFLDGVFAQIFGQIVSIIVTTLSNTNLGASRCFKMKKTSLPVDVQVFGQIFSIKVTTLRNTNLGASRCFKMKKTSLPVDVRRSKMPLLKLPNMVVAVS